jgi:hypothetical protein
MQHCQHCFNQGWDIAVIWSIISLAVSALAALRFGYRSKT